MEQLPDKPRNPCESTEWCFTIVVRETSFVSSFQGNCLRLLVFIGYQNTSCVALQGSGYGWVPFVLITVIKCFIITVARCCEYQYYVDCICATSPEGKEEVHPLPGDFFSIGIARLLYGSCLLYV